MTAKMPPSNQYEDQKAGSKGDAQGSEPVIPANKCGAATKGHGIKENTMTPNQNEYRPQVAGSKGG